MCVYGVIYISIMALTSITRGCPSELCRCTNRGVIVCSYRRLERVPHFAREIDKVYEALDISHNDIYTIPPHAFKDLLVKSIVLNNNPLIGISPRAFDGIEAFLEKLDMHSASLDVLHWGVFRKLCNLKELNLVANNLFALPMGLFDGMPELIMLTFQSNKLSILKHGMFRGLWKLRSLDLSDNHISIIHEDTFEDLRQLKILNLKDNIISNLNYRAISGLDSLEELYLDNNRLSDISPASFSLLPSLISVSIQDNNLTVLQTQTFSGAPSLKSLYLDNNRLYNISNEAFTGINKLNTLSLEHNKLKTLGDTCTPSGLKAMTSLKLEGNPLDCVCRIGWIYSLMQQSGTFVTGRCESPTEHRDVLLSQLNFTACLSNNC